MKPFSEQITFRPSEFMRQRRPELFSDSVIYKEPQLTREVFEYHLETLTSRKQENEFEHFCRRLAEKELCPNLVPQTGPTGGGDGKVDTETYPVSDAISMRWYEGVGREAAQERWAFAFSAKKQWRPKVLSDVAKIVETRRGYSLVYFITNQFVPTKARSEVEDKLRLEYSVDVRILDRTWIVTCVFEKDRIQLAIDTLRLTGIDEKQRKRTGPRDFERQEELTTLEKEIADPERYRGVDYQLAEDCLQTCLLARHLEFSREEIEGRFERAERIAERVANRQQMLRISYCRAWTMLWWFDDYDALNNGYEQVEKLAVGTEQADDLQLLSNLWHPMHIGIISGYLDPAKARFEARTLTLQAELDRLSADANRPNNALHARTIRTIMNLTPAVVTDPAKRDELLEELKEILSASEGLASYPLETVATIIRDLGEFITDSPSYDALFEQLAEMIERRRSNEELGKVLLERGIQKLRGGKKYEAVQLLGRAQQKLGMQENRAERITALVACGSAYESSGLLWAARSSFLAANNLAFSALVEHGTLMPQTLDCTGRLAWVEMRLGRLSCVLAWVELMSAVSHNLMLEGEELEAYLDDMKMLDRVFGLLLLKTDLWELKWVDFLPRVLEELQFYASWMALLYALGYEDRLRSEEVIPQEEDEMAVRDFFLQWLSQPAARDLPDKPELMRERNIKLHSMVLGCVFQVECPNHSSSIYLAETILGFLEAFMATSTGGKVFPNCSTYRLLIKPSDFVGELPQYDISQKAEAGMVEIRHSPKIDLHTTNGRAAFRFWVVQFLAHVIPRVFSIANPAAYLTRLAHDELVFCRAWLSTDISVVIGNILGQSPKFSLADWESNGTIGERFPLLRQSPWHEGLAEVNSSKGALPISEATEARTVPYQHPGVEELEHRNVRVCSLINKFLWDKAGWSGTVYIVFEHIKQPPLLGLGFTDAEAGKAIFEEWIARIGRRDLNEELKVSIITGIDEQRPFSYRVRIGTDPGLTANSLAEFVIMISRMCQMDPTDHGNLSNFLERYKTIGWYVLLPVHFKDGRVVSEPFWRHGIFKRNLAFRPAWTIGENDPDAVVLHDNDKPIIPDGVDNAPVLNVLKRRANQ